MLLGRILLGAACAALAASVIYICIKGTISKQKIKEEMNNKRINKSLIQKIDNCNNTINFKDLESGTEYQISGDDIDDDIYEDEIIYA